MAILQQPLFVSWKDVVALTYESLSVTQRTGCVCKVGQYTDFRGGSR